MHTAAIDLRAAVIVEYLSMLEADTVDATDGGIEVVLKRVDVDAHSLAAVSLGDELAESFVKLVIVLADARGDNPEYYTTKTRWSFTIIPALAGLIAIAIGCM